MLIEYKTTPADARLMTKAVKALTAAGVPTVQVGFPQGLEDLDMVPYTLTHDPSTASEGEEALNNFGAVMTDVRLFGVEEGILRPLGGRRVPEFGWVDFVEPPVQVDVESVLESHLKETAQAVKAGDLSRLRRE